MECTIVWELRLQRDVLLFSFEDALYFFPNPDLIILKLYIAVWISLTIVINWDLWDYWVEIKDI